jgi:copper chaperone CopZ
MIIRMKHMFSLFAFVGILFVTGCRVSDIREVTVNVPGMTSEADVQRIRKSLAPLNGVNREQGIFDTENRKIVLTYDSMVIAKKNIEIAIAEAGYDANTIAAIKAAPAK